MKKIIILKVLLLVFFINGCENAPYVRSDIFVDTHAVKKIYIMPIVTEVTIDSLLDVSREELQNTLKAAKEKIKNTLKLELAKRGYEVGGYSKSFEELDQKKHEDELIRLSVQEFLHSTGGTDHDDPMEIFLGDFLEAILKGDITVTDEEGNVRKIKKEEAYNLRKEMNSLVAKSLAAKEVFPKDIDTLLYIEIKSFIAKRGFWKSLQEESTITTRIKLVNINEEKIIFSYQATLERSDIIDWKSLEKALNDVLAKIPVKLDS